MTRAAALLGILMLCAAVSTLPARSAHASHDDSRRKTQAVTIRGIIANLHAGGFSLKTNTHGVLQVVTQRATQITEYKHKGTFKLAEGDHVGVHGFQNGSRLTAISVRIYPVKPTQFSVRGVVGSVKGSEISVTSEGKTYIAYVSRSTGIKVTNGPQRVLKNDRVLIRLEPQGSEYLAIRIRIYSRKTASGKHVVIEGTAVSVHGSTLILATGSTRKNVRLTSATALHSSSITTTRPKLAPGQHLRVYACCEGGPLTATSIHILITRVTYPTQLLHGTAVTRSSRGIVARVGNANVAFAVDKSTKVTLRGTVVGVNGIRSGDELSIHAWKNGSHWQAASILIHASSREPHTVSGRVVATRGASIIVARAGKQYTVTVNSHTSVTSGVKRVSVNSIHAGDHAKAVGMLSGLRLAATSVRVTPTKPKTRSIRGTIQSISSAEIVVSGDDGRQYRVRPGRGVKVTLKGAVAPVAALAPGTRIHAKGYLSGNVLSALTVSVSVESRTIQGRITHIGRNKLQVESRSTTYTVDLVKGAIIADGGHTISLGAVHVGAYARVAGFVTATLTLRAMRVDIYHPHVVVIGTIATEGANPTVTTTAGITYTLHLSPSLRIAISRLTVTLTPSDLAAGMHIHAEGNVGTDGVVQVSIASVRLTSLTIRGQLTKVESGELTVQAPEGTFQARLNATTSIVQTTIPLKWNQLVVGDDVTIYGYRLNTSAMITRKVEVHRERITLTGTVTSVTSDGFVMDAGDGPRRVIATGTALETPNGQPPTVGAVVHVHGYVRGDGVVLATDVTLETP